MIYLAELLAVALGILLGYRHVSLLYLTFASLAILSLTLYLKEKNKSPIWPLLLFLIASLFAIRTAFVLPPTSFQPSSLDGQAVSLSGVVSNQPENGSKWMTATLKQVSFEQPEYSWHGSIQLNLPLYSDVLYGDKVSVTGILLTNQQPRSGYVEYQRNHQVYGNMYRPDIKIIQRGYGVNPLIAWVNYIQQRCRQSVISWFPRDESGLLLGIVLGIKQPLSAEFNNALKSTSTTHIIVASGYNAAIVVATTIRLTSRLKKRNSIGIALIVLAVYVAVAGFNPSIIRAAIMSSLAIAAQVAGRQRFALHLLTLTAICMLLINPLWLFDISFQLSFAATVGIIVIEPILDSIIKIKSRSIREVISTTISAQVCTMPIIALAFGKVALIGLSANFLILWAVPWVMAVGSVAILVLVIAPELGHVLQWLVEPGLWYIKQAVLGAANLPWSSIDLQVGWYLWLVYYLALAYIVWRFSVSEKVS